MINALRRYSTQEISRTDVTAYCHFSDFDPKKSLSDRQTAYYYDYQSDSFNGYPIYTFLSSYTFSKNLTSS